MGRSYPIHMKRFAASTTTTAIATDSVVAAFGKTLVVGSGVIGLQTALECVRRNRPVVLRSPFPPADPRTCSLGAGGFWFPFHVESEFVTPWAIETLNELLVYAQKDPSLVEVVPAVRLLQDHQGPNLDDYQSRNDVENPKSSRLPAWSYDKRIQFQHLTVEMLCWQNMVNKLRIPDETTLKDAGYWHAWLFHPPVVNTPNMLQYLLRQLEECAALADVDVNTNHIFSNMDELCDYAKSRDCTSVINCTGLGSRELCQDDKIVGGRGILLHYDRSHCPRTDTVAHCPRYGENIKDAVIIVDDGIWASETMPTYLIPRGDTIVVGGSYLEGDTETGIRSYERERLLLNANRLGIDTDLTKPVGEWTGFRPFRSTVRCEVDHELMSKHSLRKVIHNYGHGGSGWTLFVGAAKHAINLLESIG